MLYHEKVVTPIESKVISRKELERLQSSKFRITTVTPFVKGPTMETYVLDQFGMDLLLEGYKEYAQFLVGVELVEASEKFPKRFTE
jgi:hypothetical protein